MPKLRSQAEILEVFADRLQKALNEKHWEIHDLQRETGFAYNRIQNWRSRQHIPHAPELVLLAEVLGKSTDWLLGADTTYQDVTAHLGSAAKFLAARDELITNTKHALWLQVRSGNAIQTAGGMRRIEEVMKREREKIAVRLLICSPDNAATLEIMAMRRDTAPMKSDTLKGNIVEMIEETENRARLAGASNKLSVMTVPYLSSAVVFISDPAAKTGTALVQMFNFKQPTAIAPMMLIKKEIHREMFNFFVDDFNRLWDFGAELQDMA